MPRAPVASVARLRETSVLVAALRGTWLLNEHFGLPRAIGTVLIVAWAMAPWLSRGRLAPTVLRLQSFHQCFDLDLQSRNVGERGVPNLLGNNVEVVVHQPVAHARDLLPRHVRRQ